MDFKGLFKGDNNREPLVVKKAGEITIAPEGISIDGVFTFNRLVIPMCHKHVALACIDWAIARLLQEREDICLHDKMGCYCNE